MLQTLANHNVDLKRLIENGYAVAIDGNYLIVRDIPYLDQDQSLKVGAIVTQLEFVDSVHVKQQNHQVSFSGSEPYGVNGLPIPNLGNTAHNISLSPKSADVNVQRQFSNKPNNGYLDFYDKITRYVVIISGPAIERYGVSPFTRRIYEGGDEETVFKYRDTLTSRAEIDDLSARFHGEYVAIIGLGGTGSYVLDFMAKVPVKGIIAFDGDSFHVHNAFRSPGKLDNRDLGRSKAAVYADRYAGFRNGLIFEHTFFDDDSVSKMADVTFAFVCVDSGPARAVIIDILIGLGIPFIDVGMGLNRNLGSISGTLRTTVFTSADATRVKAERLVPTHETQDDVYKANIQIAELNALNAAMAVLKYKKHIGFYADKAPFYHSLLSIADMQLQGLQHEI
jgi:ThiF family